MNNFKYFYRFLLNKAGTCNANAAKFVTNHDNWLLKALTPTTVAYDPKKLYPFRMEQSVTKWCLF